MEPAREWRYPQPDDEPNELPIPPIESDTGVTPGWQSGIRGTFRPRWKRRPTRPDAPRPVEPDGEV
jgi:hypothetical protein